MHRAAKCARLAARLPRLMGRAQGVAGGSSGRVWLANEGGIEEKEDDTALASVVLLIRHSPVRGKETA